MSAERLAGDDEMSRREDVAEAYVAEFLRKEKVCAAIDRAARDHAELLRRLADQ